MATEDFPQINEDSPDWLKNLRKEVRELRSTVKELTPLQKENAVLKAGIDLNNPVADLFLKAYDGETTVEAIKEAAAKYGLAPAPDAGDETPAGTDEQSAAELAALEQINEAGAGAPAQAGQAPDYMKAQSAEEFIAQYRAAGGMVADQ